MISRMDTIYVNRTNTNELAYQRANHALQQNGGNKEVRKFSDEYRKRKLMTYQKNIVAPGHDPIKQVTLNPHTLAPIDHGTRRWGRPKNNWVV